MTAEPEVAGRVKQLAASLSRALERLAFGVLMVTVALTPVLVAGEAAWSILGLRIAVAAAAACALTAWSLPGGIRPRLPATRVWFPLLLYLGLVGLATWASSYRFASLQAATNIVVHALGFLLVAMLAGPARRRQLATALLGTSILVASYGIAQAFGMSVTASVSSTLSTGFFYHYSHFAGYLGLIVPLAYAAALFGPDRRVRRASAVATILLVANVALTSSYAGWVVAASSVTVLTVIWMVEGGAVPRRRVVRAAQVGVLVLATVLTSVGMSARLDGNLRERLEWLAFHEIGGRIGARAAVAGVAGSIIADHSWRGVGPGNFRYAAAQKRPPTARTAHERMLHATLLHAHNDYLQVAATTGLPGLLAFLAFWGMVLVPGAPLRGQPALRVGATAALGALLLHGLVDANLTAIPATGFLAHVMAGMLHGPAGPHG